MLVRLVQFYRGLDTAETAIKNNNANMPASFDNRETYTSIGVSTPLMNRVLTATTFLADLESKGDEISIPKTLTCPISLSVMDDPITVSSGITYDRELLRPYFRGRLSARCPATTIKIFLSEISKFKTNVTIKNLTQQFLLHQETSLANQTDVTDRCVLYRWPNEMSYNIFRYFQRSASVRRNDSMNAETPLIRRNSV